MPCGRPRRGRRSVMRVCRQLGDQRDNVLCRGAKKYAHLGIMSRLRRLRGSWSSENTRVGSDWWLTLSLDKHMLSDGRSEKKSEARIVAASWHGWFHETFQVKLHGYREPNRDWHAVQSRRPGIGRVEPRMQTALMSASSGKLAPTARTSTFRMTCASGSMLRREGWRGQQEARATACIASEGYTGASIKHCACERREAPGAASRSGAPTPTAAEGTVECMDFPSNDATWLMGDRFAIPASTVVRSRLESPKLRYWRCAATLSPGRPWDEALDRKRLARPGVDRGRVTGRADGTEFQSRALEDWAVIDPGGVQQFDRHQSSRSRNLSTATAFIEDRLTGGYRVSNPRSNVQVSSNARWLRTAHQAIDRSMAH